MNMKCKRCGRPLRSAMALRTGYGEHCRRGVYRAARVLAASDSKIAQRAAHALLTAEITPVKHGRVWRIASSSGESSYLASPNTCNCDGAMYRPTANTEYHSVAAAVLAA